MRGGKPVLLRNWWSPPGPASASAPGPASESEAGSGLHCVYSSLPIFLGFAADALQDSRCGAARVCHGRGAGFSPGAWNTIREAISRDTSSSQHAGHAVRKNRTRSAAGTFSGHCPVQSEDLPPEVWLPSLSDDERLFHAARSPKRRATGYTHCLLSPKQATFTVFCHLAGRQTLLFLLSAFFHTSRKLSL